MPKSAKLKPKAKGKQLKPNKNVAAVIDIGSNAILLKIAQRTPESRSGADETELTGVSGEMSILEELRYPLSLGADTFTIGKIELDTINKLCKVLSNYLTVIRQYNPASVRAFATTALREASNKDYIVDIIKSRTGLSVDISNDVDEKSYIYKEVTKLFAKYKLDVKDCLMAYIGIGNLGVAFYENGRFPFMHSLRLGSLRLSELFENVLDYGENYFEVVDEYQYSVIDDLRMLAPDKKPSHFVACGSEVMFISTICGAKRHDNFMYITKKSFLSQFEKIKGKTYDQIMDEYNISESRAELVFPFMSMCKTLLSLTCADKIIMPLVYIGDAVLSEELFSKEAAEYREKFNENIIIGAESLAERYGANMKHARLIKDFSAIIFEKLKKQNGFSKRDGLLLSAAAIMHDTGKYINIKNHDDHAYSIISGSDISGLDPEETEFVACICKFNGKPLSNDIPEYQRLTMKKRVLAAKLSAILGIAETLDRSHTQKFNDIDICIVENIMTITVTTYKDILLEEWAFKEKAGVFEQVFGIKTVLKRKKAH